MTENEQEHEAFNEKVRAHNRKEFRKKEKMENNKFWLTVAMVLVLIVIFIIAFMVKNPYEEIPREYKEPDHCNSIKPREIDTIINVEVHHADGSVSIIEHEVPKNMVPDSVESYNAVAIYGDSKEINISDNAVSGSGKN